MKFLAKITKPEPFPRALLLQSASSSLAMHLCRGRRRRCSAPYPVRAEHLNNVTTNGLQLHLDRARLYASGLLCKAKITSWWLSPYLVRVVSMLPSDSKRFSQNSDYYSNINKGTSELCQRCTHYVAIPQAPEIDQGTQVCVSPSQLMTLMRVVVGSTKQSAWLCIE